MSARTKMHLILGAFVFANLAVWGGKQLLAGAFEPIIRSLGA